LIGALVERERADRPLALSYLAIATAAVVATAVNLALVDRDYIALGVRDLGQFLPGLGAADGRVAFAALGSGLSAVFAALGFIRLRDRPQRLWNRSPLSSRGLMLVSLGLWLLFVLWNLTLRPMGTPVEVDHDAHNLLRLFMVSTPLGLILLITLSPLVATARGSRAWMTLASIGYLAFMVLFSSHTAPDVWWMRRYLPVLLPAVALVVGIGVQWLTERSRNRYPRVIPGLLISVVLVGTALQGVGMSNLVLRHEVNTEAPTRMIELMAALPPDAPVVVMHRGSRTVLGMGNALRALRPVATLFVKDPADIAVAIKVVQAVAGVAPVVISGDLIDDLIADAMGLKIVHRGTYPRQWADTLALIAENPTSGRHDGYLIYATPGS
jgi:multisubunit Na+/H+ antiporter MnhG subunit